MTNNQDLEDYSISSDSQKSYCDQLIQISRKKVTLTMRNKQTIIQETICPMIMILVFIVIANVNYVREGSPMDLSVEKTYPSQPLIYNTNYRQYASGVKYLSPQDFIDQSVNCQQKACEKDFWTKKIPMKMTGPNITVAEPDISKQFKQFDSMAYKKLEEMGTPSYGNIFINEISGKTNYQY